MLIDTLNDKQTYFKSTLLETLQEARADSGLPIASSYKSILRRERNQVPVYQSVLRDPTNGWRMYTGRQIRNIVQYELKLKARK